MTTGIILAIIIIVIVSAVLAFWFALALVVIAQTVIDRLSGKND